MNDLSTVYAILSFIFSTVVGSFLNVCIYRMPLSQSIVYPPSHCPLCNKRIKWYDNVPLVSYIILRGKCRYCGAHISLRYFFVELITGVLGLFLYLKYGLSVYMLIFFIFSCFLMVGSFIDLSFMIIPDRISITLIILGIVSSYLTIGVLKSVLSAAFGFALLYLVAVLGKLVFKKDAMGGGDIKLMAGIGAFLGIKGVVFVLFCASFVGSIIGLTLIGLGYKKLSNQIPFGPFLSLSAIVYIFVGKAIIRYLYGI